ncbi:MAG: 6-carboxytetrahydropterin synthase [Gemmatimonadetes bacterium]|jgi:6-pyruvoyltetrahydropterin/6-carboxytetrahydropterin synthase|nr:6-carboxytetrahydropterin synthase [Gemmatimonadota bacterium]
MDLVRITRKAHFSAAHRLYRPEWSEERNVEVFGDCSSPNWHGHNYELVVTVEGVIDPETGFVMNLRDLKKILQDRVVSDMDHRNLNTDVPWLSQVNPTTENLAVSIWSRISDALPSGTNLVSIVVNETPRNSVEYRGPQEDDRS